MTIPQLRQVLGAHLGQVLTPDIAARIELATFAMPGNNAETEALLNQWRHLIEPVVQASITPMPWPCVLATRVNLTHSLNSVLVTLPEQSVEGVRVITIWIAAGDMAEVLGLLAELEAQARANGVQVINYVGRRGWLREAGFTEHAVIGRKEI